MLHLKLLLGKIKSIYNQMQMLKAKNEYDEPSLVKKKLEKAYSCLFEVTIFVLFISYNICSIVNKYEI